MPDYTEEFTNIPYGPLGIIALPGCEELADKIDRYIVKWRAQKQSEHKNSIAFAGYEKDSYIINASFPRFGTGEGKGTLFESVRGYDIFIVADMFNYGLTYKIYGHEVPMSPDEHYANLKRAISAIGGKAHRITVIMPMLYEGRQHKRSTRESLDCALALQELCNTMGVDNIITFDAHDPRVQNAIPLKGFENVQPVYQMIKSLANQKAGGNWGSIDVLQRGSASISIDSGITEGESYTEYIGNDSGDDAYNSALKQVTDQGKETSKTTNADVATNKTAADIYNALFVEQKVAVKVCIADIDKKAFDKAFDDAIPVVVKNNYFDQMIQDSVFRRGDY